MGILVSILLAITSNKRASDALDTVANNIKNTTNSMMESIYSWLESQQQREEAKVSSPDDGLANWAQEMMNKKQEPTNA
jgi:hypothetical protein